MDQLLDFRTGDPVALALAFVLIALASARLTRLVVQDKITAPVVEAFRGFFDRRAEEDLNEAAIVATTGAKKDRDRAVRRAQRSDAVARFVGDLTTCTWCVSVWTSFALAAAWWGLTPSVWFPLLVAGLALSEVAGRLRADGIG